MKSLRVISTTTRQRQKALLVWFVVLLFALSGNVVPRAQAQSLPAGETFRDCVDCPEMVVVPSGNFLMGSSQNDAAKVLQSMPADESFEDRRSLEMEQPQHQVMIARPFAIAKYDVTRAEFAAFVRATGYSMSGDCFLFLNNQYKKLRGAGWQSPGFSQTDRDPVVCVSWQDAEAYVAWLNSGLHRSQSSSTDVSDPYRLPSEAEWEYAARAGTETARWWGDAIGSGNAVCDGCGSRWDEQQTAPVGSFAANPFGLFDVLGNVWNWTADCLNVNYLGAPSDGAAWTAGDCAHRIARGGSWTNRAWVLRSAHRTRFGDGDRTNFIGFRVAKTLP